jgi:hypothetical protein
MARKNSRAKGKRGELEAAHFLTELFEAVFIRGAQHAGSGDSPDIKLQTPAESCDGGLGDLHFEVKRAEQLNLLDALQQAERDAGRNRTVPRVPVVLHRRNKTPWMLTFRANRENLIRLSEIIATHFAFKAEQQRIVNAESGASPDLGGLPCQTQGPG